MRSKFSPRRHNHKIRLFRDLVPTAIQGFITWSTGKTQILNIYFVICIRMYFIYDNLQRPSIHSRITRCRGGNLPAVVNPGWPPRFLHGPPSRPRGAETEHHPRTIAENHEYPRRMRSGISEDSISVPGLQLCSYELEFHGKGQSAGSSGSSGPQVASFELFL